MPGTGRAYTQHVSDNSPSALPADPDSTEGAFASHLAHTVLRMARLLRQLGHEGVPASQSTAMMIIDRYGPLTIGDLATFENISRPTASQLVNKLVAEGYVKRSSVEYDNRISLITLTRRGRSIINTTRSVRMQWFAEQLSKRTPEELDAIRVTARILDEATIGPDQPWDIPQASTSSLTPRRPRKRPA